MLPIVTLTTDFGHVDSYVAAMKGRILSTLNQCHLVDVTHAVPPGNVLRGALAVRDVAPFFPKGTIHLVVVDPGVGSSRRPMIVRTPWLQAVGPDNGVLSLLWEGHRNRAAFFQIDVASVVRGPVSATFHGRDLFAPAAAVLASGMEAEQIGRAINDPVELELPPTIREQNYILGEVLYHDAFGNLVTNIRRDQLPGDPEDLTVDVAGTTIWGVVRTYSSSATKLIALIGSTGLLEIAVPGGSAFERLGVNFGTRIRVALVPRSHRTGSR